MKKFYQTDDCPRAAFIDLNGFRCIGAIPGDQPGRKKFVIEYDDEREAELLAVEARYFAKDDKVSAIEFWRTQKRIKRYINDIKK